MDVASALITVLIAGASAVAKDTASAALRGAYAGLKVLIGSRLSSLTRLEAKPESETARASAVEEAAETGLVEDQAVLEGAKKLSEIVEAEAPEAVPTGVDLQDLKAALNIRVAGNSVPIRARGLEAGGGIEIIDNSGN